MSESALCQPAAPGRSPSLRSSMARWIGRRLWCASPSGGRGEISQAGGNGRMADLASYMETAWLAVASGHVSGPKSGAEGSRSGPSSLLWLTFYRLSERIGDASLARFGSFDASGKWGILPSARALHYFMRNFRGIIAERVMLKNPVESTRTAFIELSRLVDLIRVECLA